ncbi:MAG: hypothetical protein GAK30_02978 [Paracidovorax wautersii]|uniref:Uncharacterized protein n=1 Tax=Paracidovorax wautersii TaxID=1177982 RepID=A0A7V8JP94_9BURK|nr:MAG: hypothetical protein GAK30_02978 [Paracidovorax wautersii]
MTDERDDLKSPLWAVAAVTVAAVVGAVWLVCWVYWSLLRWIAA